MKKCLKNEKELDNKHKKIVFLGDRTRIKTKYKKLTKYFLIFYNKNKY